VSLGYLAYVLAARNHLRDAQRAMKRALRLFGELRRTRAVGVAKAMLADFALWEGHFREAAILADEAWSLADVRRQERDFIRAARVQGLAALGLGNLAVADERLHFALTRARVVEFSEEELPALVGIAELRRRQGNHETAREHLEEVREPAERGPFPLHHADALMALSQIEREAGNLPAAVQAAIEAYRKAWCDGPPYDYYWGRKRALDLLTELGASLPKPPDFDESKYEPIPEVEIDPPETPR
jgi:tetratricopeptide (TPR) repeat protein